MITATVPSENGNGNSQVLANAEISRQSIDEMDRRISAIFAEYGVKHYYLLALANYSHKGVKEREPFIIQGGNVFVMHSLLSKYVERDAKHTAELIERLSNAHVTIKRH